MTSQKQIAANQANAALSTGPRTAEGKAIASGNARKHGFTAKAVLLPGESEEEYNSVRNEMLVRLAPLGTLEQILAQNVVDTFWKYIRMERVENTYVADRIELLKGDSPEPSDDSYTVVAGLFGDRQEAAQLSLVLRYLTSARNAWNRAEKAFQKAQEQRFAAISGFGEEFQEDAASCAAEDDHGATASENTESEAAHDEEPEANLPRAERRRIERARRKAEKNANRNGAQCLTAAASADGFVSQSAKSAA